MDTPVYVIIVAAGSGSRFGATCPKQYAMLNGQPVLVHTITRFKHALPHCHIITVVSHDMLGHWLETAASYPGAHTTVVTGGATRWESVRNALELVPAGARVLVHDGARPLVDTATIVNVARGCRPGTSVIPVYPVSDSLRLLNPGGSQAVDRASYRAVATPQGFMSSDLKDAYLQPYDTTFTDDASVMEARGYTDTLLINTPASNIKITHPGDLALAAWYMQQENNQL